MKKKSAPRRDSLAPLVAEVRALIQSARLGAATVVNTLQVMTNFEIGRRIVEHEQKGKKRAEYGKGLLKGLSQRLTEEFGRGFSEDNLSNMRRFFLLWEPRVSEFPNRVFGNSTQQIWQTPSAKLAPGPISETPSRKSRFTLSWSHYVLLLTIKDVDERSFYEIESINEDWSLSELKRQKASALYERLAVSRDKAGVRRLAEKGQIVTKPEDVLKEPYVLEFLGLEKLDKLTHQDLGQMQMYVNYYDRTVKLPNENSTIGILLCQRNKQAIVELTLPKDANIHAREYQLYLPSKELLKAKLLEWAREEAAKA